MKKFIFGFIAGIAVFLILSYLGYGNFMQGFNKKAAGPNFVAPENLIAGATKFGSLKVVLTDSKGTFVSNLEVDVAEHPGAKMAVDITDENGTAFFEKMPVGNYLIFFNDYTFPKNFDKPSNLFPVEISEGRTTEQKIELNELK